MIAQELVILFQSQFYNWKKDIFFRRSLNNPSLGNSMEVNPCDSGIICPVWEDWTEWAPCPNTCGPGITQSEVEIIQKFQTQIRPFKKRNNFKRAPSFSSSKRSRKCSTDGKCEGNHNEEKICFEQFCPVWGSWSSWGKCSESCGDGIMERTRNCSKTQG